MAQWHKSDGDAVAKGDPSHPR
ncbi:MAG: hypothetical protein R3F11_00980 [Verrucomicrobiales bacterium]